MTEIQFICSLFTNRNLQNSARLLKAKAGHPVLSTQAELRSRVKVEVDVLGSPSLTVPTVSVDVKQH